MIICSGNVLVAQLRWNHPQEKTCGKRRFANAEVVECSMKVAVRECDEFYKSYSVNTDTFRSVCIVALRMLLQIIILTTFEEGRKAFKVHISYSAHSLVTLWWRIERDVNKILLCPSAFRIQHNYRLEFCLQYLFVVCIQQGKMLLPSVTVDIFTLLHNLSYQVKNSDKNVYLW